MRASWYYHCFPSWMLATCSMICIQAHPSVASLHHDCVYLCSPLIDNDVQTSPAWLASVLLALLITTITWKLATRAWITWHRESEAIAKKQSQQTADIEQPLLSHEEGELENSVIQQGSLRTASQPGRAIASVRIPSMRRSNEEHHESNTHSPMAYSAVGSFAVAGRNRCGLTHRSCKPNLEAQNDAFCVSQTV